MKKKLFCLFLFLVLPICLLFVGCSSTKSETDNGNSQWYVSDDITFIKITSNVSNGSDYGFEIYVCKETKVMYILYDNSYQCGLTALLKTDGSPMLWEGKL